MEISVGFADKDRGEDEAHFLALGYAADETVLGKAFYPTEGVRITGDIAVRYEKHPWLEAFEVDGIEALPARRKGLGTTVIQEFVGTLSDSLYPPALDMYRENIERNGSYDAAEYWGEVSRRFARQIEEGGSSEEKHTGGSPEEKHTGGSPKKFRMYAGFVENMWREGDREVLDIVENVIVGILTGNDEAETDGTGRDGHRGTALRKAFAESITEEFREYLADRQSGV